MSSGLVPIFSWKTRKNSTDGSMGNKKFAKKNFCHTPTEHSTAHQESHIYLELDILGIVNVYEIYHCNQFNTMQFGI